jgi:hypothetical protein
LKPRKRAVPGHFFRLFNAASNNLGANKTLTYNDTAVTTVARGAVLFNGTGVAPGLYDAATQAGDEAKCPLPK